MRRLRVELFRGPGSMPDLALVRDRLAGFPVWLSARRTATVLTVLIIISFLRSGFVIWNWFSLSPMLITDWARPRNAFQSNAVFNAFGWLWAQLIGTPEGPLWLTTQVLLTVAGIAVISWLVLRSTRQESAYLAVALLLTTGIATVLWREIGRYDVFFLVPMAAGFLANRRWVWVASLAIAAFSAPEQALLAAITVLALTLVPGFSEWRGRAMWFTSFAITAVVAVQVWFSVTGHPFSSRVGASLALILGRPLEVPSRFDLSQNRTQLVIEKFYTGLANGPGLLWSYLGATLLILVLIGLTLRSWTWIIWLFAAVIAFPLLTTLFFGEDPTRDLAIVAAPAVILLCVVGARLIALLTSVLPGGAIAWSAWLVVIVTLLPTLYFFVQPEAPFSFAIHMLTSWNNGTPIDWTGNTR
jgi:hypothetical protein